MLLSDYQEKARTTRTVNYTTEAVRHGLFSEAGEVAGAVQKLIRGDYDYEEYLKRVQKELGDVLWHIAAMADDHGFALKDIAKDNLDKLAARKAAGTIKGDGDNR